VCYHDRQGDGDGSPADERGPGERSSRVTHVTRQRRA
jgi:hypothetical protein